MIFLILSHLLPLHKQRFLIDKAAVSCYATQDKIYRNLRKTAMKQQTKGCLTLLLTAMIWGAAFVAQSQSMQYVGPFTMQATRFLLAALVLLPVIFFCDRRGLTQNRPVTSADKRRCARAGLICGLLLFAASSLQQLGLLYTTVGKSGFITALYIILVPVVGLVLGKRVGLRIWCSVAISLAGLYFLCMRGAAGLNPGDLLTFGCAVFFTFHIIYIDAVGGQLDGVRLSCIQFFICSAISAVCMLLFETPSWQAIASCWLPIIYAGVLSGGAGYTLQIIGQRTTPPVLASIIMSLESVFAALFGWVLIRQALSGWELLGCALMFAAIILAQLPGKAAKKPA